jgi:hypothetical protein
MKREERRATVQLCAAALLMTSGAFAVAAKTDVVEFGNGSRLVGEVKGLDRGKLSFKTDATDTIAIDWADVTRLVTQQTIRVEVREGKRYFGSLDASGQNGRLSIVTADGTVDMPMRDAVVLDPVEATVADRIDFEISLGYSFAKSTGVEDLNFDSALRYDTEQVSRELRLTSQSTDSDGESRSTRNVAGYRAFSILEERWFVGWASQYESNDALALDHRITAAGIGGRSFFPSPNQRLRAFVGLGVNGERFEGNDTQTSLEGVFGGTVDWFDFGEPELDLNSTLVLFPSITETGRVRGSFDVSLRWELYKDLFWKLSLFDEYDSRPEGRPTEPNPSNNDYGVTTGVGWSW